MKEWKWIKMCKTLENRQHKDTLCMTITYNRVVIYPMAVYARCDIGLAYPTAVYRKSISLLVYPNFNPFFLGSFLTCPLNFAKM